MKTYVVFDKLTGTIDKKLVINEEDLAANLLPNQDYLEYYDDIVDKRVVGGIIQPIPEYELLPKRTEQAWISVKNKRNSLLQKSDWTQLPDVPITSKEAWATYRQQLRDITTQSDPFNIVWPTPPQ